MNELQWKAAKKAGLAVLVAICVVLLFRMSPILAVMLVFLGGIGGGSYMIFLDMEHSKERTKEYEKRMNDLAKMRSDSKAHLDKIEI